MALTQFLSAEKDANATKEIWGCFIFYHLICKCNRYRNTYWSTNEKKYKIRFSDGMFHLNNIDKATKTLRPLQIDEKKKKTPKNF